MNIDEILERIKKSTEFKFSRFLEFNFLKSIFLSFEGRIDRRTWWYSKIFLYLAWFLLIFPLSAIMSGLNLGEGQVLRVMSLSLLVFFALGVFVDAKRLQDRSINGLLAVVPYVMSIPYYMELISESILNPYKIIILMVELYIFVNAGFLKGNEQNNKYGTSTYTVENTTSNVTIETSTYTPKDVVDSSKTTKLTTKKIIVYIIIGLLVVGIIGEIMGDGDRPTGFENLEEQQIFEDSIKDAPY